jgi:hypothetical protein
LCLALLASGSDWRGLVAVKALGIVPWPDDAEPVEPGELPERRPAKFYAPAGECEYCDRRRAASARSMRESRERGER